MNYLSGKICRDFMTLPQVGWMATPDVGNTLPRGPVWAFDNACFAHPGDFNWDRWERALRRKVSEAGADRLLFVVAPDVPFDAEGTIWRFNYFRTVLRRLALPIAFVTQDGMGVEDVPWRDIDAIFVGGSTEWKTGHESGEILGAARAKQKWTHMGRVNSLRRLRAAWGMGCQSADGTFLKYAPDQNLPRLERWFSEMEAQPTMRLVHNG